MTAWKWLDLITFSNIVQLTSIFEIFIKTDSSWSIEIEKSWITPESMWKGIPKDKRESCFNNKSDWENLWLLSKPTNTSWSKFSTKRGIIEDKALLRIFTFIFLKNYIVNSNIQRIESAFFKIKWIIYFDSY